MMWGLLGVALWLALGVWTEHCTQLESRRRRVPFTRGHRVFCYVAGPLIVPVALVASLVHALRHFFRS